MKTIKEANLCLFKRYIGLINKAVNPNIRLAYDMCKYALNNDMLEDKQSRWLGFVQGVLYCNNMIEISEERNLSRKLFHSVYSTQGIPIPKSVDLNR